MKHAIVAVEDKRFYEHRGIDLRGMARALWTDVTSHGTVQGGSTITQQFVKNAYLTSQKTIGRKLVRGGARLAARAALVEGPDPHRLPEHGLLRQRRLRGRAGVADLLPPSGEAHEAGRGGAARRDPGGPEPLGPGRAPEAREGAPQSRPAPALRAGLHHPQPVRRRQGRPDAEPGPGRPALDAGRRRRRTSRTTSRTSSSSSTAPSRTFGGGLQRARRRSISTCSASRARRSPRCCPAGAATPYGPTAAIVVMDAQTRLGARDGRRRELPPQPVQPRDAG